MRGGDPVSDAEGAGLLEPLWAEGLAVYVSKRLNPDASWDAMLLSEEMVKDGTERLPELAAELPRPAEAIGDALHNLPHLLSRGDQYGWDQPTFRSLFLEPLIERYPDLAGLAQPLDALG